MNILNMVTCIGNVQHVAETRAGALGLGGCPYKSPQQAYVLSKLIIERPSISLP
jgi:hypothetical protein